MKKLFWLIPALTALSCASVGADDKKMKPYPAAESGYQRHVIELQPQANENQLKIELLPGKVLLVDCNRIGLGGQLTEKVAMGWGYTYYVLEKVSPPISTKMACPPDVPSRQEFVPVRGMNNLYRYNSKLPVVVYVPEGYEVRYRIWQAGDERKDAVVR